jgi:hypothetical protein
MKNAKSGQLPSVKEAAEIYYEHYPHFMRDGIRRQFEAITGDVDKAYTGHSVDMPRVRKFTNAAIVSVRPIVPAGNNHYLVYLPKPEHAILFWASRHNLREVGPADRFHGCVAALNYSQVEGGALVIRWMQAGFKTSTGVGPLNFVTRPLATLYGGFRKHLIEQFFEEIPKTASSAGLELVPRKTSLLSVANNSLVRKATLHSFKSGRKNWFLPDGSFNAEAAKLFFGSENAKEFVAVAKANDFTNIHVDKHGSGYRLVASRG